MRGSSMLRIRCSGKTSQFFRHSERFFANETQMRICHFKRGTDGVPKLPKITHHHWSTQVWSSMYPQFPRKTDFRVILAFSTLDRVLGLPVGMPFVCTALVGVPSYIIQWRIDVHKGLFSRGVVRMLRMPKLVNFYDIVSVFFANEIQMRICRFKHGDWWCFQTTQDHSSPLEYSGLVVDASAVPQKDRFQSDFSFFDLRPSFRPPAVGCRLFVRISGSA